MQWDWVILLVALQSIIHSMRCRQIIIWRYAVTLNKYSKPPVEATVLDTLNRALQPLSLRYAFTCILPVPPTCT